MVTLQTTIAGSILGPTAIRVNYTTLPGNNPKEYENWIGIWQGTMVPYDQEPHWRFPVESQDNEGEVILSGLALQRKPYIVGYALGKSVHAVCATLQFAPGETPVGVPGRPFALSLKLLSYSAGSLVVSYASPPGRIPAEFDDAVMVWPGSTAAMSPKGDPESGACVEGRSNDGSQAVTESLVLAYKSVYTIGYAMGGLPTAQAASVAFETGESIV